MCSPQEQTFFQVNDSHEAAMPMTEEVVSRRLSAINKTYFYFTTASLAVCLVFALATIMVLIVQRKDLASQDNGHKNTLKTDISIKAFFKTLPNTSAAAYLKVSKQINSPILKWTENGILQNITYNSEGNLVIHVPGLYLIYCNLHFHLTNVTEETNDLKMELLVRNTTKRQTLFTPCTNNKTVFQHCTSDTGSSRIFQELSIFHLVNLDAHDWISVKTEHYKYLDLDILPNDSILAVLRYSGECTDCSL